MLKSLFHLLSTITLLATTLLLASPGAAQSVSDGLSITVQAGFDGYYKEKVWTPVTIRLENNGASLEGTLEVTLDDYTQPDVVYRYPIVLPTVSRKEINLAIYPETSARAVQVTLLSGRKVLGKAEATLRSMSATDPLFGVLSASPSAFNLLADLDNLAEYSGTAVVAQLDAATFPTRGSALEALNVIVLNDVDTNGAAPLSPAQVQALGEWTAAGGRLVIAGGASWQKTTAGLEASGLLPLLPKSDQILGDLQPVQSYTHQSQPDVSPLATPDQGVVVASGALQDQANVLAGAAVGSQSIPLVVQKDYGAGSVFFLAFDPTLEPFASWAGSVDFYRQLLGTPLNKPTWLQGFRDWYSANNAAQSMPGIRLPSSIFICGLLVLYIAILGPLNYIFLRVLKRREMGWISLPLTVMGCSILVFVAGTILRSGGPVVSRLSMVQIWPGVGTAHVDSLVSLYSPNRAGYELELPAPAFIHRLPTDPPTPNQALTYAQDSEKMRVSDLHLDSGSLAPFAVETTAPAPHLEVTTQLALENGHVLLSGEVTNQSELTLETTVVHTPAGSDDLGTLAPGQTLPINLTLDAQAITSQGMPTPLPMPSLSYPIRLNSSGPDALIGQILGTTDYYNDREAYRRYQMVFSALGGYNQTIINIGGLYLTAWSNTAPYDLTLPGDTFRSQDTTLYIVQLKPTLFITGSTLDLPPGLFSRHIIENTLYSGVPYYIYSGQYLIFEDTPIVPLPFTHATSLQVNLVNSMASGAIQDISLSLWDNTSGQWELYENPTWGPNLVDDPARFISPQGGVRVKIEGISAQGTQVENIEISLVMER